MRTSIIDKFKCYDIYAMMHPYEKKVSMFDTKTKTMNRGINLCSKHKILFHGPTTKIGNKTCYIPKVLNIFSLQFVLVCELHPHVKDDKFKPFNTDTLSLY